MAELHAVLATVSGRVHGVGFRYSAQRIAKNLELVGWVMNQSDGTVQTWAQGSRDAVDRFLGFLEEGPPAARVTEVNAAAVPPDPDLTGFGVRY